MYKIPENYNTSALKGQVIFQIAFGLNFISLFFDKGYIQFEGRFSITIGSQTHEFDEVYPINNDCGLLQLLEKSIIGVDVNKNRNILTLLFEKGLTLKLIGNPMYESFRIKIDEFEILV